MRQAERALELRALTRDESGAKGILDHPGERDRVGVVRGNQRRDGNDDRGTSRSTLRGLSSSSDERSKVPAFRGFTQVLIKCRDLRRCQLINS